MSKYVRYVPDVLLIAFVGLFCFGLSLVSLPAALCTGGFLGAAYAVLSHDSLAGTAEPKPGDVW